MQTKVLYNPYLHQQAIHDSEVKRKFVMQPVRSGKDICLVNDNTKNLLKLMPMWKARPKTMVPKWNVWFVAETYKLLEQLYLDVLSYTPRELIIGSPSPELPKVSPKIKIVNGCTFSFRSAKNEAYLVAEGVDRLNITEAGELPRTAWELLRSRLSSPDRFQTSTLLANGTPRGQIDPANPIANHWFWDEIQAARSGQKKNADGWYWFEDKQLFGNIDHPILSLTPEGRAEIEDARNDPNFSERKFREDFLGECLPALIGDSAIKGFITSLHIGEMSFMPKLKLHRWWDFGRNYPAVTYHQFTEDNVWCWIGESVFTNADKLDTELADDVIEYTEQNFRNSDGGKLKQAQIVDRGDFEATHKEDSRRENTVEVLKSKGINLICETKRQGDEQLAIDVINARMRKNGDGTVNFMIHPRCTLGIRCLQGAWIYQTGKMGQYEYRKSSIAELHPWIDIFDTIKYGIVGVVQKQHDKVEAHSNQRPRGQKKIDSVTKAVYYE